MDTGRISKRYAKAIYEYALSKEEEVRLYKEMGVLANNFMLFADLKKTMENPTIAADQKKELLVTAAGISVSDTFKRVLDLIAENRRESYVPFIALSYLDYYRKEKGIVIAKLTTAVRSVGDSEAKLKGFIEKRFNKQVDFVVDVDPSIIGGFILDLENNLLDASMKHQLDSLKFQLLEKNKEIA